MKEAQKVLFISQEITPYLPESPIANICRYMPQAVQEKGREMRAFMPRFGCINERRNQLHEVIRLSGMNLIIDDTDHPLIIKVASIQPARMQVYFIDNEDFFQRKHTVSDDSGVEFPDNDERAIFFVRGVIETVKKLRWAPDVVHCHGWLSALAPLYIKKAFNDDPFFKDAKVVYSIYDDAFQQPLNPLFRERLMLDGIEKSDLQAIENDNISYNALTNLAVDFSDGVIVTHNTLAPEIQSHIEARKLPALQCYDTETLQNYADPYIDFYDSLFK
ncbi:MAG: glycogen/starch synthase [Prevotellaceae bacterium]|jgi:starch synthase|nr:glycogen/starch synthase [Prevotellaceae bacterium]